MSKYTKQCGYSILSVLLITILVISSISVWAMAGQTNTSTNSDSSADILASTIINDATLFKTQYDIYLSQGYNMDNIIYMPNVSNNSLNPNLIDSKVGLNIPIVSSKAIRTNATIPEGIWVHTLYLQDGLANVADAPAMLIGGITDKVCQRIQKTLYGSTLVPVNSSASSSAQALSGATKVNPNIAYFEVDLDSATYPQFINWNKGCININNQPDNNIYFQILHHHN